MSDRSTSVRQIYQRVRQIYQRARQIYQRVTQIYQRVTQIYQRVTQIYQRVALQVRSPVQDASHVRYPQRFIHTVAHRLHGRIKGGGRGPGVRTPTPVCPRLHWAQSWTPSASWNPFFAYSPKNKMDPSFQKPWIRPCRLSKSIHLHTFQHLVDVSSDVVYPLVVLHLSRTAIRCPILRDEDRRVAIAIFDPAQQPPQSPGNVI